MKDELCDIAEKIRRTAQNPAPPALPHASGMARAWHDASQPDAARHGASRRRYAASFEKCFLNSFAPSTPPTTAPTTQAMPATTISGLYMKPTSAGPYSADMPDCTTMST